MKIIQTIRRYCAIALVMSLLMCVLPANVWATEAESTNDVAELPIVSASEDATNSACTAQGTCGDNLTWRLDAGTLTISGTGDMYDYDLGSYPWQPYSGGMDSPNSDTVRRVIIEEGVTSIGEDAFRWFAFIETVEIPSTVTRIGASAFGNCERLKQVTIPDGVTELEEFVFGNCYALSEVTIPDSVTMIGEWAFSGSGLEKVTIPSNVVTLSDCAFRYCDELKSVSLSEGLVTIGAYVFEWADIGAVRIPDSVTTMDIGAFANCGLIGINFPPNYTAIRWRTFIGACADRLVIPSWIEVIEENVFSCTDLKEVVFRGDAPQMNSLFDTNEETTGWDMTVYYPGNNETWTQDVFDTMTQCEYGLTITFVPYQEYEILNGGDSVILKGEDLAVRANGAFSDFVGVSVDEKTISNGDYAVAEGSTIVTLKSEYLDTLTSGMHTLTISFIDGEASTTFTLDRTKEPAKPATVPMFRMYDPNSGEHFYTGSELERQILVNAGWHYEGVGFNFPVEGAPVHRLYDPVYGEHLYTMDAEEMSKLLGEGWNYESVAFNSAGDDEVPQYRLHNPNAKRGAYHFTGSTEERDLLISLGWEYQGIGWYSCIE